MAGLDAEFNLLLESFDQDPSQFSKVLRSYSAANPDAFVSHARKALQTLPPCRALKCLTNLLTLEGLLKFLLEEYARSREGAITLAKKILQFEPRFDAALIEYVEDKDLVQHSEQTVLYALDILDEISERDRLVLNILTFLKHPSPKLRSKAARMLGRRRPNATCMDALITESDARVRANAVESLFRVRNDYSHNLFRLLAKDSNNRVAGNARLGLYLAGDTDSIQLIDELAYDRRPNFRNTGAWVIGRTADPRFSTTLGKLMTDSDELVRAQSFRAMRAMKDALKTCTAKDLLNLTALHHEQERDAHRLIVTVSDPAGQPLKEIPGTRFLIRMDGSYVREYKVREHDSPNSLNIAFVLCLPREGEEIMARQLEDAVERCLPLRRLNDKWAVLKLTHNSHWARFGQPNEHAGSPDRGADVLYSGVRGQIGLMLHERPTYLDGKGNDDALHKALRDMLAIDSGTNSPDILFVGDAPEESLLAAMLRRNAANARCRVHAALIGDQASSRLQELIETTGGLLKYGTAEDLAASTLRVYSSLVHRYELLWEREGQEMNVSVDSETSRGSLITSFECL